MRVDLFAQPIDSPGGIKFAIGAGDTHMTNLVTPQDNSEPESSSKRKLSSNSLATHAVRQVVNQPEGKGCLRGTKMP